jgi:hypothetical protein
MVTLRDTGTALLSRRRASSFERALSMDGACAASGRTKACNDAADGRADHESERYRHDIHHDAGGGWQRVALDQLGLAELYWDAVEHEPDPDTQERECSPGKNLSRNAAPTPRFSWGCSVFIHRMLSGTSPVA